MISSARRHSSARARQRADRVERPCDRDDALVGTSPDGRPVAGDPAERGRDPDRPGRVRAERDVDEPGGDGRAAAAARSSRRPLEIPRVAGRAEVRAVRERAERELVRVQLPDDRGAGRPEAGDALGVALGHAVEDLRRRRGRHARDVDHVLDADPPVALGVRPVQEGVVRVERHGSVSGGSRSSIAASAGRIRVEEVEDALEVLVGRVDALLSGGRFP